MGDCFSLICSLSMLCCLIEFVGVDIVGVDVDGEDDQCVGGYTWRWANADHVRGGRGLW